MIGVSEREGTSRLRRARRRAVVGLVAVVAAYLLAGAVLAVAGLHDRVATADVVVVPGNTVAPDGTPSPRLRARLDAALWLYRGGRARLVFVSGGTGVEGVDEADAMARYLVAQGVPEAAIVRDPAGVDTDATARNVAAFAREASCRRPEGSR